MKCAINHSYQFIEHMLSFHVRCLWHAYTFNTPSSLVSPRFIIDIHRRHLHYRVSFAFFHRCLLCVKIYPPGNDHISYLWKRKIILPTTLGGGLELLSRRVGTKQIFYEDSLIPKPTKKHTENEVIYFSLLFYDVVSNLLLALPHWTRDDIFNYIMFQMSVISNCSTPTNKTYTYTGFIGILCMWPMP